MGAPAVACLQKCLVFHVVQIQRVCLAACQFRMAGQKEIRCGSFIIESYVVHGHPVGIGAANVDTNLHVPRHLVLKGDAEVLRLLVLRSYGCSLRACKEPYTRHLCFGIILVRCNDISF